MTDIGTALHEAAMYGKLEVVKLLLDYGVDPNLENSRKRTVFDILEDLNTSIAKQIEDVIKDHMTLIKLDVESDESLEPVAPPQGYVMGSHPDSILSDRCSLSEITPPRQFCSPSIDESLYDVPPPPKLVNKNTSRVNDSLDSLTASHSQDSCFDQTSCSSCSPSKCDSSVYENNIYQNVDSDSLLYEIPPPPSFFATKRFSDPLQQCSIYQNEEKDIFDTSEVTAWRLQNSYIPMLPSNSCSNRPRAPAKPPRKSVSPHSSESKSSQRSSYEFLCLASSGMHECSPKFLDKNKNNSKLLNYSNSYHKSDYVDMANRAITTYENHNIICANGLDFQTKAPDKEDYNYSSSINKFSEILPLKLFSDDLSKKGNSFNNLMPSKSTPALHASRHTLDQVVPTITKELSFQKPNFLNIPNKIVEIPTNYEQPPTPDNPPPSPGTAEIGIHEKIHPTGQVSSIAIFINPVLDENT
ncbi:uncharacterized protein [Parasteatoda tepidariorum]|uniref:uncharacterized protein n=1 Tax=Parasteatoda tepidariorum TaxID=114398 RepID=UPI001C729015|nr:uncharacterized protein LOC122271358 [Parasteatoda tepidariorum]